MMMSTDDVEKLERNRPTLMEGLNLEDGLLLAELRAPKVITQHQEEIITQAGTNTLKAGKLVDFLLKGDSSTLGHLRDAMLKTNHAALVEECFGTKTATGCPSMPPLDLSNPEYCHARKLAEDKEKRNTFLEKLRFKSERMVPRGTLLEVVRQLGLNEKLLVYLVFLVPEVCEQIGRLFVIKRIYTRFGWKPVNFQYYMDLLNACKYNDQSKDTLKRALVDAGVMVCDDDASRSMQVQQESIDNWFDLLQQLSSEQRAALLEKTHNLQLCVNDGQQSTLSSKEKVFIANEFVLGLVYLYDCSITTDRLEISRLEQPVPVRMLTRNMSGVKHLHIEECELCESVPVYMPTRDMSALLEDQLPDREDCSLEEVQFLKVKGMTNLGHCQGAITSGPCRLKLSECDDVNVTDLKRCFPEIEELHLDYNTVLQLDDTTQARCRKSVSASDKDNTIETQMSIVDKIAEIGPIIEFFGKSLHLTKIASYCVNSEALQITAIRPTPENNLFQHDISMRGDLVLGPGFARSVAVPLGQFLNACSPFLRCRRLKAMGSTIDLSVGTMPTLYQLCELELQADHDVLALAKIFVFCSRCLQLEKVIVNCNVCVDDDALQSVPQIPKMVTFIFKVARFIQDLRRPTRLSDKNFTQDKLRQSVHTVCPSANVVFEEYPFTWHSSLC